MITTKRPYVFISYASEDKSLARELFERLRADGIEAWLDVEELLPGQDWRFEINKAIENSDAIIVCLSSRSLAKEGFVHKELKLALEVANEKPEGKIYIIPARLDDCDVPLSLHKYHWADLYDDKGYEEITRALKTSFNLLRGSAKPMPQEETEIANSKLVQLTIIVEKDILKFTDKEKEGFVSAISKLTGVSSNEIRVVQVTEGSMMITLELPEAGAKRLMELYYKNDTEIEKLCISKITLELESDESKELFTGGTMEYRMQEIQQKRHQFLLKLFEKSQGDELFSIDAFELGDQLGFSRDETNRIDNYLRGESLIQGVAGTRISITHRGIVVVEKALSKPSEPITDLHPIGNSKSKEEIIANTPIKNSFDKHKYLYKYFPGEGDFTFFLGSHLLVEYDQLVILYKNGRPCDVFHKGEYIVSRENIPELLSEHRPIEDGDPLSASFCFFSTRLYAKKWGTPQPITVHDKEFGLVGFQGWGSYDFCIAEPDLIRQHSISRVDELDSSLTDLAVRSVSRSLSEMIGTGKSVLQIPNELQSLEEMAYARFSEYSKAIGFRIPRFSITILRMSDKSQESINNSYRATKKPLQGEQKIMYDVFISYATGDAEIAHELRSSLESKGLKCFMAEKDIQVAAEWQESIKSALRSSKKVLVLLTPRSINRPWVLLEAGAAWALGKPLIPAIMMIDVNELVDPIRRHQARKIETIGQRQALAEEISRT